MLAYTLEQLMLGRLLQGISAGAFSICARATMRDHFSGIKLREVASYTGIAFSAIPLLSPLIGGYVQYYLGWRVLFATLVFLAFILLWLTYSSFSETIKQKTQNVSPKATLLSYFDLLNDRFFTGCALTHGLTYGVIVAFALTAPVYLQIQYAYSPIDYAWAALVVAVGYMLGAFINSRLSRYLPLLSIVYPAFFVLTGLTLMLVIFELSNMLSVSILLILMFMVTMSIGFINPSLTATCLQNYPHKAGSASALFGAGIILGGVISSAIVSSTADDNLLAFSLLLSGQSILAFVLFRWLVCQQLLKNN